jgi:membrane associated rhomboid family serine protease
MAFCSKCGSAFAPHSAAQVQCVHCAQACARAAKTAEPAPARVTTVLIVVNVLAFLATLVLAGGGRLSAAFFHTYGGNWGPITLQGQWFRLITSIFLHSGTTHLVANMWALWILGRMAERCWTQRDYLLLYFGSGIAGSLAAVGSDPLAVTVGASGAIFGLAGALIAGLLFRSLPLKGTGARQLVTLMLFTVYNIVAGANNKTISNAAHLGGVLCGFALGAFLTVRDSRENPRDERPLWQTPVFAALVFSLLAGCIGVRVRSGYAITLQEASQAIENRDFAQAEAKIEEVLQRKPRLTTAYLLLAHSFDVRKDPAKAVAAAQKAVDSDPGDLNARTELGILQFKSGDYPNAITNFDEAVRLCEQCAETHYNLGVAYFMNEDYDGAIREFQTTVSLREQYSDAGQMLEKSRRAKERRESQ